MSKRKITSERRARRKQLLELLQGAGITDVAGVQELLNGRHGVGKRPGGRAGR